MPMVQEEPLVQEKPLVQEETVVQEEPLVQQEPVVPAAEGRERRRVRRVSWAPMVAAVSDLGSSARLGRRSTTTSGKDRATTEGKRRADTTEGKRIASTTPRKPILKSLARDSCQGGATATEPSSTRPRRARALGTVTPGRSGGTVTTATATKGTATKGTIRNRKRRSLTTVGRALASPATWEAAAPSTPRGVRTYTSGASIQETRRSTTTPRRAEAAYGTPSKELRRSTTTLRSNIAMARATMVGRRARGWGEVAEVIQPRELLFDLPTMEKVEGGAVEDVAGRGDETYRTSEEEEKERRSESAPSSPSAWREAWCSASPLGR